MVLFIFYKTTTSIILLSSVCKGNVSFLTIFNVNVNESVENMLKDFKQISLDKVICSDVCE